MPKDRSKRTESFGARSGRSPYIHRSNSHHRGGSSLVRKHFESPKQPQASAKDIKEWDEIRCPVCMDHPHNAVLLHCTSRNKGCRPFMCDTSSRHSNCLDQYRKTFSESLSLDKDTEKTGKLLCPLCRGEVTGHVVVEPARRHMNSKPRSCSTESCGFSGAYGDLRKHARKEHPSVRPTEADPDRQSEWRRLERQTDMGDLLSTIGGMSGSPGMAIDGAMPGDPPMNGSYRTYTLYLILSHGRGGQVNGMRSSIVSSRSSSTSIHWGERSTEAEPFIISSDDDSDDDDYNDVSTDDDPSTEDLITDDDDDDEAVVDSRRRPRRQFSSSDDEEDQDVDIEEV